MLVSDARRTCWVAPSGPRPAPEAEGLCGGQSAGRLRRRISSRSEKQSDAPPEQSTRRHPGTGSRATGGRPVLHPALTEPRMVLHTAHASATAIGPNLAVEGERSIRASRSRSLSCVAIPARPTRIGSMPWPPPALPGVACLRRLRVLRGQRGDNRRSGSGHVESLRRAAGL